MKGTLKSLEYDLASRCRPGSMSTDAGREHARERVLQRKREIDDLANVLQQLHESRDAAMKVATMLLDALHAAGAAQDSCEVNAADLAYRSISREQGEH